jgi:hypothetical protein
MPNPVPLIMHSPSRLSYGLTFVVFLLAFTFPVISHGQDLETPPAEEELEEPTFVFSGIAWQGSSIEDLGYFIDGKERGEFVEVFLPNGGRSRKYAYYGESPLTFYRAVEVEKKEEETGPEASTDSKKKVDGVDDKPPEIVYHPVVDTAIDSSWKEVFLFFFKDNPQVSAYRVKPINFDPVGFPAGSYWFFSRCDHPLSLQFGLDKGQLPAFGQAIIKARLDEFGDLVVRVFEKKGTALRKVYSTIWSNNPRTRTIVFMLPTPNGVKVRRIVDVVQEEKALGLRPRKEDGKRDKSSPAPPGS